MKPTLNIIGAGKVGKVLGHRFHRQDVMTVQDVMARTLSSAVSACDFIGAGNPVSSLSTLRPADIWMLAVPDDQIQSCSRELQRLKILTPASILFHCSGAHTASKLGWPYGAASIHPMRSFADQTEVARLFSPTLCTIEGDDETVETLWPYLVRAGARPVRIKGENKVLYHAAAVITSNYLVTLIDTAIETFKAAGLSQNLAEQMAEPMARETLQNIFRIGTRASLTGPIVRGDTATVALHQDALRAWDPAVETMYTGLAGVTQNISQRPMPKINFAAPKKIRKPVAKKTQGTDLDQIFDH